MTKLIEIRNMTSWSTDKEQNLIQRKVEKQCYELRKLTSLLEHKNRKKEKRIKESPWIYINDHDELVSQYL